MARPTEAVEKVKSTNDEGKAVTVEVVRPRAGARDSLGRCIDCNNPVFLGQHVPDEDKRRKGQRPLHAICLIPKPT